MAKWRRNYTAAQSEERCQQDIIYHDGSGAQCMRRGVKEYQNGKRYCVQHYRLLSARDATATQPIGLQHP